VIACNRAILNIREFSTFTSTVTREKRRETDDTARLRYNLKRKANAIKSLDRQRNALSTVEERSQILSKTAKANEYMRLDCHYRECREVWK